MKNVVIHFLLITSLIAGAQTKETERIIEVNGKAEMEIVPDEITFIVAIEEYWKEEFEKRKDVKDYKTKVPLAEIEDEFIKNLKKAGIERRLDPTEWSALVQSARQAKESLLADNAPNDTTVLIESENTKLRVERSAVSKELSAQFQSKEKK